MNKKTIKNKGKEIKRAVVSAMKKPATYAIPLVLAGALSATPVRAEFYDGCRGPTEYQLDQRMTLTADGTGYKPIAKHLGDDLFVAVALPTQNGEAKAVGGGIGVIVDDALGDHVKTIPMLGFGVPIDGSGVALEPTVYATGEFGKVTIDPRIWSSIFVDDEGMHYNGTGVGATVGYGFADRFRAGIDVERTPDGQVNTRGIASMVLEPKKQVLEVSVSSNDQVQLRYVFHIGD